MRKIFFALFLLLFCCFVLYADQPTDSQVKQAAPALGIQYEDLKKFVDTYNVQTQEYKIGDTGPAGGLIFFDKGNNSDGWRYLEAAPASTEVKDVQWSISGFNTAANGVQVGTGKLNTQNIMDASVQAAVLAAAARYCYRLQHGGFNDWYLPSKNELGLMYMNLKVDGLGGFGAGWYWSSTERDGSHVWTQNFNNGQQNEWGGKDQALSVRAIRRF